MGRVGTHTGGIPLITPDHWFNPYYLLGVLGVIITGFCSTVVVILNKDYYII